MTQNIFTCRCFLASLSNNSKNLFGQIYICTKIIDIKVLLNTKVNVTNTKQIKKVICNDYFTFAVKPNVSCYIFLEVISMWPINSINKPIFQSIYLFYLNHLKGNNNNNCQHKNLHEQTARS